MPPWNPGGTLEDESSFWPEITCLCNLSSYSWSLHGDFNATLLGSESSSTSLDISPSRLAYSLFLTLTDAIDLWRSQPTTDVTQQYTHRSQHTSLNQVPTYSIIDRSAVSRVGTLTGSISLLPNFIPSTDHKPIDTRISLLSPAFVSGFPDIPQEVPPSSYSPRFRHPFRSEKHRLTTFSSKVDDLLSTHPSDLLHTTIASDSEFQTCYDAFTHILLSAAKMSFNLPSPHPQIYHKIRNPTIKLILRELLMLTVSFQSSLDHATFSSFPSQANHGFINTLMPICPPAESLPTSLSNSRCSLYGSAKVFIRSASQKSDKKENDRLINVPKAGCIRSYMVHLLNVSTLIPFPPFHLP